MNKKVYVVGGSIGYANWLEEIGYKITRHPDEANLLLFTGGSDIGSNLYGQTQLNCTWSNPQRDEEELEYYQKYVGTIPMWGTCRGHQFLSALSGSKMIQDLSHPGRHLMNLSNGESIITNSLHHQCVHLPDNLVNGQDYYLLAWADRLSSNYIYADNEYQFPEDYKEVEAIYWPKNQLLGVQFHPEMLPLDSEAVRWCQEQVKRYFW